MNENRLTSRKFWMAVVILIVATSLLLIPPILGLFGMVFPSVLSSGEWINVILGIFGLYAAGNVAEKHLVNKVVKPKQIDPTTNKTSILDVSNLGEIRFK